MRMSRWIAPLLIGLCVAACSKGGRAPGESSNPVLAEPPEGGVFTVIPPNVTEGIAARINNEIVTWKDVLDTLKQVKTEDITLELRMSRLRELAEERLFLQAARLNQLTISEQDVDDAMMREVKNAGGEEEFEKYLRIKGKTKTEYREELRRTLLRYKLFRHLLQKSWTQPGRDTPGLMLDFVAPEEIRRYFGAHPEQFRAIEHATFWRIGLQFSTDREEEGKREIAESILRKIEEGGEFSMMAWFYSDIPRARGYHERGTPREEAGKFYSPDTVQLLFDRMKEGEISPIVKDGKTLNIFKLEQKVNQKEEPFEDAQVKIRSFLEHERREKNRQMLRDHLLKGAYLWPADLFDR